MGAGGEQGGAVGGGADAREPALTGTALSRVSVSKKLTVPVGVEPLPEVTVAVKVASSP